MDSDGVLQPYGNRTETLLFHRQPINSTAVWERQDRMDDSTSSG